MFDHAEDKEPARDIDYCSPASELLILQGEYALLRAKYVQLLEYHARARKRLDKIKERARRKRLLKGWDRNCVSDSALGWLTRSRRNLVKWDHYTKLRWGDRYEVSRLTKEPMPTQEEFQAKLLEEHKMRVSWWLLGSVPRFPCE
jgi:hypothetical protein